MTDADVIVVGGGGAGLAAAIEAASLGRRVILVEKAPALGGSTAWSVGSISATNTRLQREAGIVDSPNAHFEDLETLAGSMANRDNRALRRILVDNTTEMMAWLEALGLVFAGPQVEPPHRLPRMHNVLPNSRAFPERLGWQSRRLGVDVRLSTLADGLIEDGGRVIGVRVRAPGGGPVSSLFCVGGVVLAGGDYSANAEMKARFAGPRTAELDAVNPGATGDAIRIALAIGAQVANGDIVRGPIMRFVPPDRESLLRRLPPRRWLALGLSWSLRHLPEAIKRPFAMGFLTTALGPSRGLFEAGAILVNAQGRRFSDELGRPGDDVPGQPGRLAYIVMDGSMAHAFRSWPNFVSTAPGIAYAYLDDYRRSRRDIYREAPDVATLGRVLGLPSQALEQTIADVRRQGAIAGQTLTSRFERGPYVALGPVRSYVVFTDGGLRVTERLEVLGRDGAPIPGLFAAGSAGQGGLLLEGHGHHLGWAFVSGRLAGRHAAYAVPARLDHGHA